MAYLGSARYGAVASGGALAALLWTAQARSYCREIATSPPGDYDPVKQGCFGANRGLPPLFWRNQCVSYSIQRAASRQVPLGDASRVASDALGAWVNAVCPAGARPSILAYEFPTVDCAAPPSLGHNNAIIFRDRDWPYGDASNSIGYTTLTVDLATGEILGATIEINSGHFQIVTTGTATNGAYDLTTILTHEAGHFFGLAHSDDSGAVMYTFYKAGTTALTPDDVAGICSIYAEDGSRNALSGRVAATTCDPVPPQGFSVECGSADAGVSAVGSGPRANARLTDGGGDGGAPPCSFNLWSCAVGHKRGGGDAGACTCGLLVLGFFVRRARRPRRPAHAATPDMWTARPRAHAVTNT